MDQSIPILPCTDFDQTLGFYRAAGFEVDHLLRFDYAFVRRGPVELHLFAMPGLDPGQSYAGCYVRVDDVDEWHARFAAAGVPAEGIPRVEPVGTKPWGMREFGVVDPSGNLIRVGSVAAGKAS